MKRAHRGAGSKPGGVGSLLLPQGWYPVGLTLTCTCSHPQLFSIVVFGSIVNEGYLNSPSEGKEFCIYNRNPNACSYGVAVGVLAFLTCLLYLALDVYFPQISSVKDRKKAVLSDIGVSGECLWAPLARQSLRGALRPLCPHTHPRANEVQASEGQTWGPWLAAGRGGARAGPRPRRAHGSQPGGQCGLGGVV